MQIYATGTSGTIGKHLQGRAKTLEIDLSLARKEFELPAEINSANLIHLAGIVGPKAVIEDEQKSIAVNISGTAALAESFKLQSQGIFYYVSTSHVYAPSTSPINEYGEVGPVNRYAEQKYLAENELKNIFSDQPNRLCIIRVFSVLDWDVAPFTLGGGIRKLALREQEFELSCSDDIRDFLTPRSIADALFKVATVNLCDGVFNLCSGVGVPVGEAARRMLKESGFEVPENQIVQGYSATPYVVGDNSKLKASIPALDLNWTPSTFT